MPSLKQILYDASLGYLISTINCTENVPEQEFKKSVEDAANSFLRHLKQKDINTHYDQESLRNIFELALLSGGWNSFDAKVACIEFQSAYTIHLLNNKLSHLNTPSNE